MHITRLQAENFKKLVAIDIQPGTGAGLVPILGRNAQGKSSTLDAIQAALGGKSVMPSRPVRAGEEQGAIRIEIDGGALVVRRTFDADGGGQIVVENAEGFRTASPQKMLDGLYASVAFDPLAFTRLEPKAQLAQLRKLVKLDVDIDALQKAIDTDYDTRRDKNRELKSEQARLDQMPAYENLGQKVDETALEAKIAQAGEHNAQIERRKVNRERFAEKHDENKRALQAIEDRIAELEHEAKQYEAIIDDEAKQLANAEPLPDPIDVSEAQTELRNARDRNAKIEADGRRVAQAKLVVALEGEVEKLTKAMGDRKDEIAAAIARAEMPVSGLSFGDGEVLLNSLPLEQASSAEQLRLSTAIGMAGNPKLRVMLVRDGSLLDDEGEKILAGMAEEHGFQLWLEQVAAGDAVGIVIEDGAVKDAPEPETILPKKRAKKSEIPAEGSGGPEGDEGQTEPPVANGGEGETSASEAKRPQEVTAGETAPKRAAFSGSMFDDDDIPSAMAEASPAEIEEEERFADRDERQELFDDMIHDGDDD